jgi:hypothetical protein
LEGQVDSAAGLTDDVAPGRFHQPMRHSYARVLAIVAFAGLLSAPATTARLAADHAASSGPEASRPAEPGVLPLHAKYKGLTYGGDAMSRLTQ